MKFFGAKKRDSRRTEQKEQSLLHSQPLINNGNVIINVENRTDVDAGIRETQQQSNTQQQSSKRKGTVTAKFSGQDSRFKTAASPPPGATIGAGGSTPAKRRLAMAAPGLPTRPQRRVTAVGL